MYKKIDKCDYYKKGSNTAVYIVKKNNIGEDLILRITINPNFEISKYRHDINLNIKNNLPDYLYYGIINVPKKIKYHYSICKKYHVMNDMIKDDYDYTTNIYNYTIIISFNDRWIFFQNLLKLLMHLELKDYLINDFKLDNIGYDDNYNPIIIDYDQDTINKEIKTMTYQCHIIYNTTYVKSKSTLIGFTFFIFKLFFDKEFNTWQWIQDKKIKNRSHYCFNFNNFPNIFKLVGKKLDVPDKNFHILKNIIQYEVNRNYGIVSKYPQTYQEIYNYLMKHGLIK